MRRASFPVHVRSCACRLFTHEAMASKAADAELEAAAFASQQGFLISQPATQEALLGRRARRRQLGASRLGHHGPVPM